MKKLLALFFILSFATAGQGQNENDSGGIAKNAVFVEIMGNGLLYSINYERLIPLSEHFNFSGRIGASMDHPGSYYLPVLINIITGKKAHNFECGIGTTIDITHYSDISKWSTVLHLTMNIGYRYQKPGGRWFVKAGFTPIRMQDYAGFNTFQWGEGISYYHPYFFWFGIGAGWRF